VRFGLMEGDILSGSDALESFFTSSAVNETTGSEILVPGVQSKAASHRQ